MGPAAPCGEGLCPQAVSDPSWLRADRGAGLGPSGDKAAWAPGLWASTCGWVGAAPRWAGGSSHTSAPQDKTMLLADLECRRGDTVVSDRAPPLGHQRAPSSGPPPGTSPSGLLSSVTCAGNAHTSSSRTVPELQPRKPLHPSEHPPSTRARPLAPRASAPDPSVEGTRKHTDTVGTAREPHAPAAQPRASPHTPRSAHLCRTQGASSKT